ncbi:MAG TPA: molybdopterin-dependent oxidoreductase [Vicinamibacterales bacterium]
MAHLVRSACPYDCPDTCGLIVEVEDGRAVRVRGDREHPYSRGSLCPKMDRYDLTVHSPRRLEHPLVRIGAKGEGRFRTASWEEAVDLIATRFRTIVGAHGAEAILPYSYAGTMGLLQRNAGHAFFHRLGASRLDRTICSPAKEAGWKAVMGDTPAPDPDEAVESDLIVLWGIDALATNIHFVSRAREAKRHGASIWLVDTHRTATARVADRVVLLRPGSDGALALGLMHVLHRDGLVDAEFLASDVQGWGELARDILPGWTPARTAESTGISPGDVEDLARAFGAARAPFIRLGSGLSRYGNGAMTIRTIVCLPAVVGAWCKRGGGCLTGTSSAAAFDLRPILREDLQPQPTRLVNMNRLGHALTELDAPRVMSLYVYQSNPAAVAPDQNQVLAGLSRGDLFTVVHERFMTDTARWADVVLPATSSLEHPDVYRAYGHYCVQRVAAAIPPVGESRSNWDVFSALAHAMGFDDEVFRQSAEQMLDVLLAAPSPWRAGIDGAAMAEGRAQRLQVPPRAWRTPSGRIEILNPRLRHPLPQVLPTNSEDDPFPLVLQTGVSMYALNSSFRERDDLVERDGAMRLKLGPADAAARGLVHGERVLAWNDHGEVEFELEVSDDVPAGVAVAEGVHWQERAPGSRTVNALTSQRLTDDGAGSTFYDNRIDVRACRSAASSQLGRRPFNGRVPD